MLVKAGETLHAKMVAANVANPPSPDVLRYFLEIIANTFGIIFLSLIIGLGTGHLGQTAIILVVFGVLRFISGGYHLRASWACVLASSAIVTAIPYVSISAPLNYALTAVAFVIMLVRAPSNYDKYARMSKRHYPKLKAASCAVVALNFVIVSDILAITYIVTAALVLIRGGENE